MRWKWFFISFSIACMFLSVFELFVNGLNFGADFLGGTKLVAQFDPKITEEQIRAQAQDLGIGDVQIVPFGNDPNANQYILRAKYIEGKDVPKLLTERFFASFGENEFVVKSEEIVGPRVGEDLKRKGLLSLNLACLLILIYIGFRFDFLFAPGAIVALIHDVLISAGFFAFFDKEFNLPILAALLTILGYSINDTIVIYDRIRENVKKYYKIYPLRDIIDVSLTETFSRTIVTSVTVFIVVLVLFYMGGGVLHDFAFCLMIGVIFGVYSSLFIASPIYLGLQKLFPTKGMVGIVKKEERKRAREAA